MYLLELWQSYIPSMILAALILFPVVFVGWLVRELRDHIRYIRSTPREERRAREQRRRDSFYNDLYR